MPNVHEENVAEFEVIDMIFEGDDSNSSRRWSGTVREPR